MHLLEIMLMAAVLVPLLGFFVLAVWGPRFGKPLSGWIASGNIAFSTLLSLIVLIAWWLGGVRPEPTVLTWAMLGSTPLTFSVNLDSLTVIMFFMVTFIATCIHVFSIGYMAGHSDEVDGECKYHRFFCYLNLFCFSMLGLVIAGSLLFLFIFWELVGLCSYLLIGFYFDKKFASNAAMKAFITNRVGDLGFIIGLAMVFLYLGDLSLDGAAASFREHQAADGPLFSTMFLNVKLATWMGILLFCGAMGKSAQFPLHVWLPDAMAGPTPVSALIHAATMVAAGVYLVARIFVLLTPEAQMFIAVIGLITLTMAALIAIVQTDIKKVLAYSTLSQLGYMIFGLGMGAWIAALFHLFTHAFFKAMLFLGSGQVIEGCHHEQDMRKMGGLRHKMPYTCWTFFIGVLAISGAWIPLINQGVGGYYSKDEILAVAYHRVYGEAHHDDSHGDGKHGKDTAEGEKHGSSQDSSGVLASSVGLGPWAAADPDHKASMTDVGGGGAADHKASGKGDGHHPPAAASEDVKLSWIFFVLPVFIAYVTPFYMMRCWWMTFMGKPRDEHVYAHAHESKLMYIPLVVLAVGTFFSGWLLFRPMVADAQPLPADCMVTPYDGKVHHTTEELVAIDAVAHGALIWWVGPAFLVGFFIAWRIYRNGLVYAAHLASRFKPLHTLLVKKFYFDEMYNTFLVGGVHALNGISYMFDRYIVDGIVNGAARVTERLASISGNVLDKQGVDGLVNGVASAAMQLGGLVRSPQVGRVRNYILFAAGGAALVVLILIFPWG